MLITETYSFSEIVDMKKEDFDSVISECTDNVGSLSGLKVLLSSQYGANSQMIAELNKKVLANDEKSGECLNLINQLFGVQFNLEYKVLKITELVNSKLGVATQ